MYAQSHHEKAVEKSCIGQVVQFLLNFFRLPVLPVSCQHPLTRRRGCCKNISVDGLASSRLQLQSHHTSNSPKCSVLDAILPQRLSNADGVTECSQRPQCSSIPVAIILHINSNLLSIHSATKASPDSSLRHMVNRCLCNTSSCG